MKQAEKILISFGVGLEIAAAILILCFFSCCSPIKTVSGSVQNSETSVGNDIQSSEDRYMKELTDRVAKLLINENLNISVKNVKYDTDKPVDSVSGKNPVSEETQIDVTKNTKINETDSAHHAAESVSAAKTKDNSRATGKTKTETKEEKETGLEGWQKALMAIGGAAVIGFVVYIIIKIKK